MNQTIKIRQIEEAYDAWGGAVYRLAMVYLGRHADAEDVTQEVFVRLLSRAPEDTLPAAPPQEREALAAVMALPERYKLPIHLHYYEGYSVAEVGEILKLGQSAVKMRLKRGREMLKLELEGSI